MDAAESTEIRKSVFWWIGAVILGMVLTLGFLIWIGSSVASRHITGNNMMPLLKVGDRVLFDTASHQSGKAFKRGEIVLLIPPIVRVNSWELDNSPLAVLERAARPPKIMHPDSSVKRIIGLPGDKIEVLANKGITVNGNLVNEPYVTTPADYSLKTMNDIGGRLFSEPHWVHPYLDQEQAITVPPNFLFVLGDNRNHSEDSHLWGFVDKGRVVGEAVVIYYPRLQLIHEP